MKRNDVFKNLCETWDISREWKNILTLFHMPLIENLDSMSAQTICQHVDHNFFLKWKQRNRCLSCQDMTERINNSVVLNSNLKFLCSIELLSAFLWICDNVSRPMYFSPQYKLLKDNLHALIDHLGYEIKVIETEQKTILVEKNPTANVVAEIVSPELVTIIFEYNHFVLKGKLEDKKSILRTIAHKLEPKRAELEKTNKTLSDDLFSLFNNLDIRHNNVDEGASSYKAHIASLSPNELEHWYDETYQTALLAFLELDHIPRALKIKELRTALKDKTK